MAITFFDLLYAQANDIQFNRDILPILSANCFSCHGPDGSSRATDLRLDDRDSAIEIGAIVPGSPDESELLRRINSSEDQETMPPPETKKKLTAAEKATLTAWIEQGARYQKHWSFVAPRQSPLPQKHFATWGDNPIDHFVGARLADEGMQPSNEADRATLIRRLTLSLTGLPPSADEVDAFVNDSSVGAYEKLVDRLLASPHYGERMAIDWLDAARYADTNGYSIDGGRQMWLWRDWVINAFNSNMPYDQFLVNQLAGDLLPNRTEAELIATGFQRNNMVTHEGGTIPEENIVNYNVDRVKTLGEAVLGLTIGCAQCHDHKYDPISQRDYYQLFAYFNRASDVGIDGDGGVSPRPTAQLQTVLQATEVETLRAKIRDLTAKLKTPSPEAVAAWELRQQAMLADRGKALRTYPVSLLKISTPNSGSGFEIVDNRVRIANPSGIAAYDVLLRLPRTDNPITGVRIRFRKNAQDPHSEPGYGVLPPSRPSKAAGNAADLAPAPKTFVLTAISLSIDEVAGDQVNLNRLRTIDRVTATSSLPAFPTDGVLDLRNEDGWSPDLSADEEPHITATLKTPISHNDESFATIQLNFGYGGSLIASEFEIEAVTGTDDGTNLSSDVVAALSTDHAKRTKSQSRRLRRYFIEHAEESAPTRNQLSNHRERLESLTNAFPTMVMDEAPAPRETFILSRGDYSQPGEKVEPGTPQALPPLPNGAPNNRLGLAQWVVMDDNPLTARVAVNRIWRILFGTGLVATPADFGAQGEWPSHPELLDWLAVDFQTSGWDVKRLVRTIVTSKTFRQASTTSEDALSQDQANRLLGRGPRFRLPAEFVRDGALKTSGLLVDWVGGPSVNPYAPGDLWREVSHYGSTPATSQTFVQDHGEKLYRRSLYTYWKRTSPPPNMTAFDAPNRESCTVARSVTVTPMQALVLLNDVQFVEAARAFAERIIQKAEDDDRRIDWAFQQCVGRSPAVEEVAVVKNLLARERDHYSANAKAADQLVSTGESRRNADIAANELAAWTQAATLLMNLSETVTCE